MQVISRLYESQLAIGNYFYRILFPPRVQPIDASFISLPSNYVQLVTILLSYFCSNPKKMDQGNHEHHIIQHLFFLLGRKVTLVVLPVRDLMGNASMYLSVTRAVKEAKAIQSNQKIKVICRTPPFFRTTLLTTLLIYLCRFQS